MRTSEYVSVGHPDKVADFISEYILDRLLEQDPETRYALEVQIKDNHVSLAGEITTKAELAEPCWFDWTKEALAEIGYTQEYCNRWGTENTIDPSKLAVDTYISAQSPDIAQGVDNDGWGDQGIFWGMATKETGSLLPRDYAVAKDLCQHLYELARKNDCPWGLDIKTQVAISDKSLEILEVVVAAPCKPEHTSELADAVWEFLRAETKDAPVKLTINGTGAYIKHASIGDCGTTGRKLAVDFYGGNCPIGGGSPWTKDATKADLTLNLYARARAMRALQEYPETDTVRVSISCAIGKKEIITTIYDKNNKVLAIETSDMPAQHYIIMAGLKEPYNAFRCAHGLWG